MTTLRNAIVLLVSLGAATGCVRDPDADHVSGEDKRVLRAMVDIACELGVDHIVISDRPAIPRESDVHDTDRRNLQFGIDFDRRLAHAARWPHSKLCPSARVVADSRLDAALEKERKPPHSWEHFSAAFDGARTLMRVSLPIYSRDGKHAVIYTESTCPYRCGSGFYHELEKTFEGWKILTSRVAWTA